ncbi:MAG: NAD(P)H-dependent oxidoreductase subunit E [Planctomycetota bacterium]|jgi:NADH:ubiquinone oxidoreductase subunit E|nr:NAD(P)H-dependent oxidoreductase subunit E [Planctomycetota bacterium]MDP6503367.1 NAD(P)H-dependent oxidoreductase subunit E [Planctomycetota bacterium]
MASTPLNEITNSAQFSGAEVMSLADELDISPESNLIGLLQDVQARFGYLPQEALQELSCRTRVPLSRIYGVVSFYEQFYTEPRGRHTVRCCRGTACHVRGGERVISAIEKTLGIEDGETSSDMMFSFDTVACLGACALAPLAVVDGVYHGKVTPRRAEKILSRMVPAEPSEGED